MSADIGQHRHSSVMYHFTKLLIGSLILTKKTDICGLSYSGYIWSICGIGNLWDRVTRYMIFRTWNLFLGIGSMGIRGTLAVGQIIILNLCWRWLAPGINRESEYGCISCYLKLIGILLDIYTLALIGIVTVLFWGLLLRGDHLENKCKRTFCIYCRLSMRDIDRTRLSGKFEHM